MQGRGQEEERQEGRPAGAKNALLEPFSRRTFLDTIVLPRQAWDKVIIGRKNTDKKAVFFSQGGTLKRPEFMETLKSFFQFKSVEDLPYGPDASFIGVNRFTTIEVIRSLNSIKAKGAVCFASGFSESVSEDAKSADLEHQLLLAAGEMAILGPNCYGFINYLDGSLLWPDQHGGERVETGVDSCFGGGEHSLKKTQV